MPSFNPKWKQYFQLDPSFPKRLLKAGNERTVDFLNSLFEGYLSEYWAVQPVRLELSCLIRLDQPTHFGQYMLRQRIPPIAYYLRLQYNL